MVAWEAVTFPYKEGGLNIKEVLAWNKTIYLKLRFDVMTEKPSLWKRWVRENYIGETNIYDVTASRNDSWMWKSLIKALSEF